MFNSSEITAMNTVEIANVFGGAYGDGCPPERNGLPHHPGDHHKGETPAQRLWRTFKETFLGGGHC